MPVSADKRAKSCVRCRRRDFRVCVTVASSAKKCSGVRAVPFCPLPARSAPRDLRPGTCRPIDARGRRFGPSVDVAAGERRRLSDKDRSSRPAAALTDGSPMTFSFPYQPRDAAEAAGDVRHKDSAGRPAKQGAVSERGNETVSPPARRARLAVSTGSRYRSPGESRGHRRSPTQGPA